LQDFLVDVLRKSRQWYIRCILPQPPYKLPGALMHHLAELEDSLEPPAMGHIDIPLVRDQIRRGNIVKAARIFKQGFVCLCACVCVCVHACVFVCTVCAHACVSVSVCVCCLCVPCVFNYIMLLGIGFPEFMSFPRFRRRYECLVPADDRPVGIVDEKKVSHH